MKRRPNVRLRNNFRQDSFNRVILDQMNFDEINRDREQVIDEVERKKDIDE